MASNYGKAKKEPYSKETVLEQIYDDDHHQHHHHQNNQMLSFGMMQSSPSSSSTVPSLSLINMNKDGAYDQLGELDQALFLYLDGQDQPAHQVHRPMIRPQHTLDIFPSEPMHVDPISTKENTGFVSQASGSKKSSEPSMGLLSNPTSNHVNNPAPAKAVKREGNRKGPTSSSDKQGPKTHDPKTLRRLAQNREAAKKSRLRKKAYVQQLETSRLRLTQLEQEIQRARSQGFYNLGVAGDQSLHVPPMPNISPDAALFDMEYARWLEEHRRLMEELRQAVHDHLPDNDLRMYVDSWLAQHEQVMGLTSMIAKSDAFHLLSGIWKTPAERCFMWMGGYRPSDLVKIILREIEALTEEQVVGICRVQQSAQEAEEALSQGLHSLYQSLTQTLISDSLTSFNSSNMNTYMSEMAVAINQLSTIEGFIQQADNLRHQTLQRLHQILTTRQAARCFLAIGEYFHRLRALSSLWLARPRQE